MTRQNDYTLSKSLIENLLTNGLFGLPELLRIKLNVVMRIEKKKFLQAGENIGPPTRKG